MSDADPQTQRHATETERNGRTELESVRQVLVGPERARLDALEARLRDPAYQAERLSDILPGAVTMRIQKDGALASALAPAIEDAIEASVHKDPRRLVDAIFPLMGPAIRMSIADALRKMIQSLGKTIDQSFSFRGLQWRFEAWRTGKPFGEVVLLHTLQYRVEQLFLIHNETGLLLAHVAADATTTRDGDMVSGMLTAIQDFVGDSFGTTDGDALDTVRVGELNVWIQRGPRATLAAVIRGTAPEEIRTRFIETLEQLHVLFAKDLAGFEGDNTPFEAARPSLANCLLVQERRGQQQRVAVYAWSVVALVAVALGVWLFFSWRAASRWNSYLERLEAAPGLVVTSASRAAQRIRGLRDPLAVDPATLVDPAHFSAEAIDATWETYQSLDPEIVEQRVVQLLQPPASATLQFDRARRQLVARGAAPADWVRRLESAGPLIAGVSSVDLSDLRAVGDAEALLAAARETLAPPPEVALSLRGDILVADGVAPLDWAIAARQSAPSIAGIQALDDTGLRISEQLQLRDAIAALEQTHLNFPTSLAELPDAELAALDRLATDSSRVLTLADALGVDVTIHITGHTDRAGSRQQNLELSQARAEAVWQALANRNVPTEHFTARGVGATQPLVEEQTEADRARNRRVSFQVELGTPDPAERARG